MNKLTLAQSRPTRAGRCSPGDRTTLVACRCVFGHSRPSRRLPLHGGGLVAGFVFSIAGVFGWYVGRPPPLSVIAGAGELVTLVGRVRSPSAATAARHDVLERFLGPAPGPVRVGESSAHTGMDLIVDL